MVAAEGCLYRVNPSVMAKPCPRVATWPSRPALRSAKESGCWAAAVAYSATGSAPLRASPQGEAWGAAFDEGALADQASGPMWASAPTRERRRRSGVAARRAADSRPYGEIGVGVAQRRKKDAVSSETASFFAYFGRLKPAYFAHWRTISAIWSILDSMSATSLNWVRQRSRLWFSRWMRKYTSPLR